ncbi:MAG: mechanosensitive ion channel family protein [Candidatus Azobacteroides sp.]|nr:mechanosensitive ion channel family protein [Candidatus Azobacteroides sp.]
MDIERVKDFFRHEFAHRWLSMVLFLGALIFVYLVYEFVLHKILKKTGSKFGRLYGFIIDLLKIPVLWLLFWFIFKIFTNYSFIANTHFYHSIERLSDILLMVTIGWILTKCARILFYYLEHNVEKNDHGNIYSIRRDLTKMKIFERLIVMLIIMVTVAVCLMSFEKVRTIGVSLLTSAGIAGIILGFAAQKSIASIFAGIQIAITQPVRLDDEVIVEGQFGTIEEISMTYVVVKLWDEKRLILPVNYFLENTFQNWTRNSSNILGTVFLYVDYSLPLNEVRIALTRMLADHPKWDKRVAVVQVTDTKQYYMEVRILLSSMDSGTNFDLCTDIREKMIVFINENYPNSFVKTRVKTEA